MSLGSWIPEGKKSDLELPSLELLQQWSALSQAAIKDLPEADLTMLANTMQAGIEHWLEHLEPLKYEELLGLIKFFTLVEMQFPQCRADQYCPAIACAKLLRKSGNKLDKDLLGWIRQVSDNRYLPYGPL